MTQTTGQQVLKTQLLPLAKIQPNTGQIPGLPKNPRTIRDSRFVQLKKSIEEFPEMLELREIVVFPFKGKFVAIGGNMRYLACKDLHLKEIPAKILPADFPVERLREFAIKDNVNFGQDDMDSILTDWSDFPVTDWGAELPDMTDIDLDSFFKDDDTKKDAGKVFTIVLNYQTEKECERVRAALLKRGDTCEAGIKALLTQ